MHQNVVTITAIFHPAVTVKEKDITAQLWRRYSSFNGLPKPTDSCQLSKSERKKEGVGCARKSAPTILVSTHSS